MTIHSGDIKLMASQRMTDTTDGGGRITGHEILSGEHNAMFPDISDLDRAYGVVNLRKGFLAVQTDNTDTYFGANVIVLLPPADPNVGLTLMTSWKANGRSASSSARSCASPRSARCCAWWGTRTSPASSSSMCGC